MIPDLDCAVSQAELKIRMMIVAKSNMLNYRQYHRQFR